MDNSSIKGLGVAMLTPFKSDGELDLAAFERHTQHLLKGGAQFLVPCGTTGETPTLSWKEQQQLIACALELTEGLVPLVVGCTSNDTRSVAAKAKQIGALGVQWIMSATPYYNKPTQEGIYQHFKALRDSGLAVMGYSVPSRTASAILPETAQRLAEEGLIFAIKEASGNLARVQKTCLLCGDKLQVLSGDDVLAMPIAAVGGKGVVSVAGNLLPQQLRSWTDAFTAGDFSSAQQQLAALLPLFEACFLEPNPIPVKAAADMMGLMRSEMRLPLTPACASTRQALQAALASLAALPSVNKQAS